MIHSARNPRHAPVAAERQRRKAFMRRRLPLPLRDNQLLLQHLEVLAVRIRFVARVWQIHGMQLRIWRRIRQHDRLFRGQPNLPVQRDLRLLEIVLRRNHRLLLALQLHPRPQLVQVRSGPRQMLLVRLVEHRLIRLLECLRVVRLRLRRQRLQIRVAHVQHHQPARRLRVVVRRLLQRLRRAPHVIPRPVEQRLREIHLPDRRVHLRHQMEFRKARPLRQQRQKQRQQRRVKSQRLQVVLVNARLAVQLQIR